MRDVSYGVVVGRRDQLGGFEGAPVALLRGGGGGAFWEFEGLERMNRRSHGGVGAFMLRFAVWRGCLRRYSIVSVELRSSSTKVFLGILFASLKYLRLRNVRLISPEIS